MGSSANLIKAGSQVRMNVQLADAEDSLPRVVKGLVRDTAGIEISEITLGHVGGGLFKSNSLVMPEEELISIQYTVYEIDGITVDVSYSSDVDIFVLSESVITSGSSGGGVAGGISDEEFIVTFIDEQELIVGVENE